MKNYLLTFLLFCFAFSIQAQDVYFYTGKNFTNYDFKNSSGNGNSNLKNGTGTFYEVGFNKKFKYDRLSYSLAVALNEFNIVGSNSFSNYQWNTQYLGIQSRLYYSYFKGKNYDFLSIIGLNPSMLLNGGQQINGKYYDLTKETEFKGLWLTPSVGLQFKHNISYMGYVSLGYNYLKSYNLSNTSNQKLGFTTNQLQFGVHFDIKSNKLSQDDLPKTVILEESPKTEDNLMVVSMVDKIELEKPSKTTINNINSKVNIELELLEKKKLEESSINKNSDINIKQLDSLNVIKSKEDIKVDSKTVSSNDIPVTLNKSVFSFSAKGLNILQLDNDLILKTIEYLIKNPYKTLILNGYSSNDGLEKDNYAISLKRAYVAKEYFILHGVLETRIETNGRGSTNPKYSNSTIEGRLKNKRVEIEFK